jgi:hypothetical protein
MATFYEAITDDQAEFIRRQHMFFVATAHTSGRINCSPKGMDAFRVLGPNEVAYLDMGGSGNETCAHLQNDGRITLMLCSFDQAPNILRLYGKGRPIRPSDPEWASLIQHFDQVKGQRLIFHITVDSTQDSCGYAVPRYEFVSERDTLVKYYDVKTDEEIAAKFAAQTQSIDGLPITL